MEVKVSPDRLASLFDLHHLRLYRLARRISGDPEEARDLVQTAFLRAARRPASIPGTDTGAEAWLVRTLVNLCRDRKRRMHVRRRQESALPARIPNRSIFRRGGEPSSGGNRLPADFGTGQPGWPRSPRLASLHSWYSSFIPGGVRPPTRPRPPGPSGSGPPGGPGSSGPWTPSFRCREGTVLPPIKENRHEEDPFSPRGSGRFLSDPGRLPGLRTGKGH